MSGATFSESDGCTPARDGSSGTSPDILEGSGCVGTHNPRSPNTALMVLTLVTREATADGLGRVRTLSQAVKAYAPDVTVAADGRAVIDGTRSSFPGRSRSFLLESGR